MTPFQVFQSRGILLLLESVDGSVPARYDPEVPSVPDIFDRIRASDGDQSIHNATHWGQDAPLEKNRDTQIGSAAFVDEMANVMSHTLQTCLGSRIGAHEPIREVVFSLHQRGFFIYFPCAAQTSLLTQLHASSLNCITGTCLVMRSILVSVNTFTQLSQRSGPH